MIKPYIPLNEKSRLENLKSYNILDTLPEEDYDAITSIASEICGTKISLISLIDHDRQWFKSHHGISDTQTPRDHAFCGHAINEPNEVLQVHDARLDERFHDNPLVTGDTQVIFYTGVPLVSTEGFALGTLCVIDNSPKQLNEKQIQALQRLSKQVVNTLELRKKNFELKRLNQQLAEKNDNLIQFAHTAAHDIKSPLNNIISITELIADRVGKPKEQKEMLNWIANSSYKLRNLIDGLLTFNQVDNIHALQKETIVLKEVEQYILDLFQINDQTDIQFLTKTSTFCSYKIAIEQILLNLVTNAIKYNDKEVAQIKVTFDHRDDQYMIAVEDNGMGIPEHKFDKIFEVFKTIASKDKYGQKGNGIGLATVQRLVQKLNGNISLQSKVGKGTTFQINIPQ